MDENCNCKKKCFKSVPENLSYEILKNFNLMESIKMQNSYLCGLISMLPIKWRRVQKDEEKARFNNAIYKYSVHVIIDNVMIKFP